MAELKQNPDGTASFVSEVTGQEAARFGGPKPIGGPGAGVSVPDYRPGSVMKLGPFAGVAATTGGAIGAWTNSTPNGLGYDILITEAFFDITTASGGAANLTVGQTPTSITTSSTNLISAVSTATIALVGGALTTAIKLKNGEFITLQGSATTATMVGNLYIRFVPA